MRPQIREEKQTFPEGRAARMRASARDVSLPPRRQSNVGGWVLLLVLLGSTSVAAYFYRERIAEMLVPAPAPTGGAEATTSATEAAPPAESMTGSASPVEPAADAASTAASAEGRHPPPHPSAPQPHGETRDAGAKTDAGGKGDAGSKTKDAGKGPGGRGVIRL